MTEGIKQLTKKNMHEVSKAINILDPTEGIDKKICGQGTAGWASNRDDPGKCKAANSKDSTNTKFSDLFDPTNGGYIESTNGTDKMSTIPNTTAKVSQDMTKLTKDQKGIVSSAFAKAHEGAEIVEIRSISTTSVMVNACYDVLAEGLPVSPYGCAG